ncbi:MAG: cryptochrome/photolyase family protein [Phycisphaerales bacterium]|nr:MAG: cryptochrome/photolyase family protein [Phycisphaerales bacterium]
MSGRERSSSALSASIDGSVERLAIILGDQLAPNAPALRGLDKTRDAVLMMEVASEAGEGPSHKMRTCVFLAAMRHYALELQDAGWRVRYVKLDEPRNTQTFTSEIERAASVLKPRELRLAHPGDWRVLEAAQGLENTIGVPVQIVDDDHFYVTPDEFGAWAQGRKSLVMEFFYREQRKKLGVLMEAKGKPLGGKWNFDEDNRASFKQTPRVTKAYRPRATQIVREVIELVRNRFPDAPGELDEDGFVWPLTRAQALRSLESFIEHRLPLFGKYEDAMWTGEDVLYHSQLSVPLNLHLLDPRECVAAALAAHDRGDAPLNSVEGFVRQLIGWREFIRGVYWHEGPAYRDRNGLEETGELPGFYWDGETDMRCMSECLRPVLRHAWAHHIPRLMVMSNFAMIAGVRARAVGDWFYGMFADSVDWVTTPNTIGMGMHADDGGDGPVVGTKPYAASGKYISRMSNYCEHCRYDVKQRTGEDACPFNTFYWDFLIRHRERFRGNQRMAMILKNVDRMKETERVEVTVSARKLRQAMRISGTE